MIYPDICGAVFVDRPNRFVAHCRLNGEIVVCHVKNTGRCRELLIPGAQVFLQKAQSSARKTPYDLIAVRKGERLVNIDAAAPNAVFGEWVRSGGFLPGATLIRPETVHGDSRFDFYLEAGERKMFVEVKGVTLERDNGLFFPDAPTQRGVKHVNGLIQCVQEGYEAACVFVIQMRDASFFAPNRDTHPEFADALIRAHAAGVQIAAVDCEVAEDRLQIFGTVPVRLDQTS